MIYTVVVSVLEAAKQTVLQKVVPFAEQSRVFGFAQSLETVASPVSTFLIGPLTQFVAIPLMTDGAGARLSAAGSAPAQTVVWPCYSSRLG